MDIIILQSIQDVLQSLCQYVKPLSTSYKKLVISW